MIEPLFGSSAPNWTGIGSPGFGWFQPGMSSRPAAFGTSPFGSVQGTPLAAVNQSAPAPTPPTTYGFGASGPMLPLVSAVPNPFAQAVPAIGQESPWGISASAILAAVAIRRGQPLGPATDQEVEEFLYDALELLPGTSEVDVRCEGGRATLTGNVQHKRLKHDIGEIAWAIPQINDVQNNVTIASRRRSRAAQREAEPASPAARKQG
jgi:hypothetical protein